MPDNKALSVKEMFTEVPATYELVNHVLTLGLDVVWRRRAARIAATANPGRWADIMRQAGFEKITFQKYLFGAVAIHRASKF